MATLKSITRRKPRVAFVLSGGGNLGALQVGMLRALVEHAIVPDVVLGCSIGAMNGAAYALDPTPAGVDRLEEHWRDGVSVMPPSRLPSFVQMVRKGESLHSGDGLRRSLEVLLGTTRRFDDLALHFECIAAEVDTAAEHWFDDGYLVPAVLASAALPAVFPVVVIEGRRYIDGGAVDNVPISRAVELGCREIYVLHVGRHGKPDAEIKRPFDAAMQAYWVARNGRFARDLAALPDGVEALVLPPGGRPDIRYDDFSHTDELITRGYDNAVAFLGERAATDAERRVRTEVLQPLERWMVSARNRTWRRDAQRAAIDPDGGVVSAPEWDGTDEDDEHIDAEPSTAPAVDGNSK
ncbi:MAG TPA: patatin-like phospholipase family protein [Microthrixaceae bacterium]|nr:patatin-like phospholipase family protein [Microthrixaceae bacterium]